ncbi:hypothetical protein ACHAW6_006892 [Cyclotella cf. meneghiniana]
MAISNKSNINRIPLPQPTSPSANFTSHVLIQTEQGRLSDASIRFNRIVDRAHARWDDEYSFSSQRCTFKPLLYALLIVLVAFSLLAIVMGEAIQEAFPLVVEEGKFMNRKSGGGRNVTQESVRMGNGGESHSDTSSFGVGERNGSTVLDDDDGALFYHVDEYNYENAKSGVMEIPQAENIHNNKSNIEYDENGLDLTSNLGEETLDSVSNLESNPLPNATIGAEVVGAPESLADNSTTSNATATVSMPVRRTNATSNETLEGSEPPRPVSTITIPTDDSENSDQPLQ